MKLVLRAALFFSLGFVLMLPAGLFAFQYSRALERLDALKYLLNEQEQATMYYNVRMKAAEMDVRQLQEELKQMREDLRRARVCCAGERIE